METDPEEQKRQVAAVFHRGAASYSRTGPRFFQSVGEQLVAIAEPKPGERVLDVGCGRGASALPAARLVGPEGCVLGLDLAPGMVAGFLEDAAAAGLDNVEGVVGDAEAPDAKRSGWDLVQAGLVLFFLPDLRRALRNYHALLRLGGRLAFSWFGQDDPRWEPVHAALLGKSETEKEDARRPGGEPFDSIDVMEALLAELGYRDIRTETGEVEVAYRDVENVWATMWSHGRRAQLEQLQRDGRLEQRMAETNAVLETLADPDGRIRSRNEMRFTLAHR